MASRKDQVTMGIMALVAVALFGMIGFEALRGKKAAPAGQQVVPAAADSAKVAPPKPDTKLAPMAHPGDILNG